MSFTSGNNKAVVKTNKNKKRQQSPLGISPKWKRKQRDDDFYEEVVSKRPRPTFSPERREL